MCDKRDFIARTLGDHKWQWCGWAWRCMNCGKEEEDTYEQEEPAVCWADSTEIDSPYLIPPRVETAHPIEADGDFWMSDEWCPLSIKVTEGER